MSSVAEDVFSHRMHPPSTVQVHATVEAAAGLSWFFRLFFGKNVQWQTFDTHTHIEMSYNVNSRYKIGRPPRPVCPTVRVLRQVRAYTRNVRLGKTHTRSVLMRTRPARRLVLMCRTVYFFRFFFFPLAFIHSSGSLLTRHKQ